MRWARGAVRATYVGCVFGAATVGAALLAYAAGGLWPEGSRWISVVGFGALVAFYAWRVRLGVIRKGLWGLRGWRVVTRDNWP